MSLGHGLVQVAGPWSETANVETSIGTLKFFDGYPSDDTIRLVYDNLDRQRAIGVFLNTISAASLVVMRRGMRETGTVDGTWKPGDFEEVQ